MNRTRASRLAWTLWVLVLAMLLVGLVTSLTGQQPFGEAVFAVIFPLFLTAYATIGALIASRHPGNAIGWIFLGTGLLWALSAVAAGLATWAGPERIDLGWVRTLDWLGAWVFVPGIHAPATFLLLLFPDGRLPSRRWRPVAWVAAIATVGGSLAAALTPGPLEDAVLLRSNPYAVGSAALWEGVGAASWILSILALVAAVVALLRRLRRSSGTERQQIRWLAYGGVVVLSIFLLTGIGWAVAGDDRLLSTVVFPGLILLGLLLVPVAAAVAILRHRLYDVDLVINRTLLFAILAGLITVVYLGVVVGIGSVVGSRGNLFLSILATAVIAVGFQPVRERARRVANRLVYGKRATPYEVLSEFGERLGGAYATEDVLPRLARVAGEGVGAESCTVSLRVGGELRPAAAWPAQGAESSLSTGGEDRVFEVRHQGEVLGALTVRMPPRQPLTPTGEKLLQDLAGQAGLILRNVRLTEELKAKLQELRASRQRLVSAQDEERRRLERNIHDGAQQQLVALAVKLRLVETLAGKDPFKAAEMAAQAKGELQHALEDLRDLARGIYPPLLADKGLAAALEAQARRAAVPVLVEPNGVGRHPPEAEAAAYFCVLEALQNVAKYAGASRATVRLGEERGHLLFTVVDDGRGFDPATTPPGSGLQNMRDRLEALGGSVDVASSPGMGTTVTGRIPVARGEVPE